MIVLEIKSLALKIDRDQPKMGMALASTSPASIFKKAAGRKLSLGGGGSTVAGSSQTSELSSPARVLNTPADGIIETDTKLESANSSPVLKRPNGGEKQSSRRVKQKN